MTGTGPAVATHGICEVARRGEPCTVCHVLAGQPCHGQGVHLCRICRAASDGLITALQLASVMHDAGVFTGASLVLDEVTA